MKRPVAIMIFTLSIILVLSIIQVSVSNQLATTGTELAAIEKEIDMYKRVNTKLQEKVLLASSYTSIAEKARSRGFVSTKSLVYLTTPPPLARRP